ncbi:MAG: D-2-hydroxyacid dehydrogenase [Castellaniella sp.]
MTSRTLPPRDQITLCFAHAAYRMKERFDARNTGMRSVEVRTADDLQAAAGQADVMVVSGMWTNDLIAQAPRLAFVQSISAGVDQYSREQFEAAGIRLASAQGANERAVAEHAMGLMLSLSRQISLARDNQRNRFWRGMISEIARREDELGGKTLVIVGMGRIGSRLAQLARAFDMHVIGVKRDITRGVEAANEAMPQAELGQALARADYVALTCPLTPDTEGLMDAVAFAAMKPSAYLVNVARGRVVDETALMEALHNGTIAGAAIDCTHEEPLPEGSPLWDCPDLIITPHTAGETRRYEDNVIDILLENLERLWKGEAGLRNQII